MNVAQQSNGQLGYGHTNNIGDQANEMGDFLDTVDLGTDFIVADMSNGRNHCCMYHSVITKYIGMIPGSAVNVRDNMLCHFDRCFEHNGMDQVLG